MNTHDDARAAVLTAAQALKARCPLTGVYETAPVYPFLAQLYGALGAYEAALDEPATPRVVPDRDRAGLCQGDPECWRYADVGPTCYHHSPIAQKPHPWQQAQLRAGVFAPSEEA